MSPTDVQIGRKLRALRGDLPQTELADQMRSRGWKWSQATVWAIEKGERSLRVSELEDLADVLTTRPEELLRPARD